MVSPGNAWELNMFDGEIAAGKKGSDRRDEYFDRTDDGHYKLKDGYEQRYLGGSGNSLGAEMTYTTNWDDDDKKKEHYGIYKTPEPRTVTETVYVDKPASELENEEAVKAIQLSNRAAEANAYSTAYEKGFLPKQGDDIIKGEKSVAQAFKDDYEVNLANELKDKAPGVLEETAQDIKQKDAYSLNLGSKLKLL